MRAGTCGLLASHRVIGTKGNTMRNSSRNAQRSFAVEDYFERKSRELIVPEDEIEAWELDAQDLNGLGTTDYFNAPGSE
jgi:hypothetical protein